MKSQRATEQLHAATLSRKQTKPTSLITIFVLLGDEMMRLGVDICGLSEVRWNGQGHFTTLDGHTIVYSGRLTQGMSGVAVWIHRKIAGALVGYEAISD